MKTNSDAQTSHCFLTQPSIKMRLPLLLIVSVITLIGQPMMAVAQINSRQIKIKETIWGFNGKIQPGQFNPVSILIDNGSNDAIDGQLILQKSNQIMSATGTGYHQTVYIGATERRWIQFYPYIAESFQQTWRLQLVDSQARKSFSLGEIKQPNLSLASQQNSTQASDHLQAIVLLPTDLRSKAPRHLKPYPEEIFPPYVTATTALHTVFLDHSPDWDEPRQKAFMDWVRLGGNVHILKARNNQYPQFHDLLTNLDQPLSTFRVGHGRIQKHDVRLNDLSARDTENAIRKGATFDRRLQADFTSEDLEDQNEQMLTRWTSSDLDTDMYRLMQERTQPEHNWLLIFCLAIIYVLLIFPGCYLLSKKRHLHFLTTYAAIAGLSLVFSVIFLFIGQRGYGESTWLQTLAIAKVADNGDLSIQQWNTLFVTGGDQYQLSAPDSQALMNAGIQGDNTTAHVIPGKNAQTSVRIPPYSAQSLNSSRYLKSSPWNLTLAEQQIQGKRLTRLVIQTDDSCPQVDKHTRLYAISGNHIHTLNYDANTQQLNLTSARQKLADFCQASDQYDFWGWDRQKNLATDKKDKDEIYLDQTVPDIVHRSLLADHVDSPSHFFIPPDRIRLLVLTTLPKQLDMQISHNVRRTGWVLYTRDLSLNP